MSNQQSVLVNFNPNFANGDASDFVQPFNKQLEIPANSEVAFYQGQLQRKTIVIPEKEDIDIVYTEQLPTDAFREKVDDGTYTKIDDLNLLAKLSADEITIKKGSYTQSEFVEAFRSELASVTEFRRGQSFQNNLGVDFLYQAVGENDAEGVFLGYSPQNIPTAIFDTSNVGSEVAINNAAFDEGEEQTLIPNATIDDWNTFITTQYPINPLSAIQTSYAAKQDDMQNVLFYDIDFNPVTSTTQRVYVNFLNDAMTSDFWSNPTEPVVGEAYPNYTAASDGVPFGFFGIEYKLETDASDNSTITGSVFVADLFSNREQYSALDYFADEYELILKGTDRWNDLFSSPWSQRAYEWKIEGDFIPRQAIRFYSLTEKSGVPDPQNLQTQETRNYYFQVLSKDYNNNGFYGYKGSDNVLFDSKDFGLFLPQRLVEDGAALQSYISDRDATKRQFLGIKPFFYMRNVSTSTKIYNPKVCQISQRDSQDTVTPMFGQPVIRYNYDFKTKGSVVRDILGTGRSYNNINKFSNEEARFDPNIYPHSRGRQAGINALYSDNQRYNYEIESLPIRTFNSTKNTNNVSGNERTILHSTESFIDGEVTELTNSFLNKNVVPSNLKYISLNNNGRILLNDIAVKITRANTNVVADEITDCSFEMLIRSKKD
jgi:hypothetical protein